MDRRHSERIMTLTPSVHYSQRVHDLSKHGMCCLLFHEQKFGSMVFVQLNNLLVRCKVVYSVKDREIYRVGLHFCQVTPGVQYGLHELVDRFSKGMTLQFHFIDDAIVKTLFKNTKSVSRTQGR